MTANAAPRIHQGLGLPGSATGKTAGWDTSGTWGISVREDGTVALPPGVDRTVVSWDSRC